MSTDAVLKTLRAFMADRDWNQFHSPENLAKSIVIEASELLECYQWTDAADLDRVDAAGNVRSQGAPIRGTVGHRFPNLLKPVFVARRAPDRETFGDRDGVSDGGMDQPAPQLASTGFPVPCA